MINQVLSDVTLSSQGKMKVTQDDKMFLTYLLMNLITMIALLSLLIDALFLPIFFRDIVYNLIEIHLFMLILSRPDTC